MVDPYRDQLNVYALKPVIYLWMDGRDDLLLDFEVDGMCNSNLYE